MKLPEHLLEHPLVSHSYRPNVAMIVRNTHDMLLWCERIDLDNIWQFPQGGIDPGEDAETAMWREMMEELGLENAADHMHIEARLDEPLRYHFPIPVIERWVNNGRASGVGQEQHFFLLRFTGDDALITLCPPDGGHREFRSFDWAGPERIRHAPWFKKDVMRRALDGFSLM